MSNDLLMFASKIPSMLAVPLKEYLDESSSVLKLWYMCDFTELLLRFMVITTLSEVIEEEGTIPDELINELRFRIEEPTLGKWRGMAEAMDKFKRKYEIMPELHDVLCNVLIPFLDGRENIKNDLSSFSELRNHLAHGGITKKAAQSMVKHWEDKFFTLIKSLEYLKEIKVIGLSKSNELNDLTGFNDSLQNSDSMNKEIKELLKSRLIGGKSSAVLRNNTIYILQPLTLYGEFLDDENSGKRSKDVQHIFSRKNDFFLQYTPVGTTEAYGICSDESYLESFKRLFNLDEYAPQKKTEYYIRDFKEDLRKDSEKLVGREEELAKIVRALGAEKNRVLWVTGNAGSGKSCLMAAAAVLLKEMYKNTASVYYYRFRSGDDRCSGKDFYRFAIERLDDNKYISKKESLKKVNNLMQFFTDQLLSLDKNHRIIFMLDGLDELSCDDISVAQDIVDKFALPRVFWICAGRTSRELSEVFSLDKCCHVFPQGLPSLNKEDIRTMVMDKIGPLKKKLLELDEDKDDEVINPFIDRVYENSQGLPLYVTYLLGDILSNRITSFRENQELPPSIQAYYKEAVNRYSFGIHQQVLTPLVSLIAAAMEPLNLDILCDYLIRTYCIPDEENSVKTVKECLQTISSLLSKTSTMDNLEGYTVYHHTFIEFMRTDTETRDTMLTTDKKLVNLLFDNEDPPSPIDIYLFKWGISHLRNNMTPKELKRLKKKLSDADYLAQKIKYQKIESFIDDIYFSYNMIREKEGTLPSSISESLIECIVACMENENVDLDFETVHNLLVFRKDTSMYTEMLKLGAEDSCIPDNIRFIFKGKLANLLRRKGDLNNASALIQSCIRFLEEKGGHFIELARLEYDVAYINHLRGNVEDAYASFEKSVQYSSRGEDITGLWISRCVQYVTGFNDNIIPLSELQKVLNEALPVFEEQFKKSGNENARRWIMNTWFHKFDAAYYAGDIELARKCWKEMKDNEWIKSFDRTDLLAKYIARLKVLEGDYVSAVKQYKLYLEEGSLNHPINFREESLAREFLEYGKVLLILGDKEAARVAFENGLRCPADSGNLFFHKKIQDYLKDCD